MAEELKACGKNGQGETFWKLCVPDEHCRPGLEVGIYTSERGLTVGGRLLKWTELDQSRARLPSQGGEAVEVVAWRHCGDKTRLLCDLGKQRAVPGTIADEFTEPLMTVAQHQRILLSTVIRCEQKGAFKICLECGYQDGHDLICQYHESKRAAVSDDLTNVRCLCCQSEHAHNSYDAGFIAGSGMCQACDSALPAKDIVSITHPADQVADDLTMVKVSRELLQDMRDLAFDQVEHHRAAMGAYKQTRQSAMDSVLAQADALLRT